jgi:hypothetical protein
VGFEIPIRGKNPLHLPNRFFFVYILSGIPIFLTGPLFLVLSIGIGVWKPPPQSLSSFKIAPHRSQGVARFLKVFLMNHPLIYFLGHVFFCFYRLETPPSMSRNPSLVDRQISSLALLDFICSEIMWRPARPVFKTGPIGWHQSGLKLLSFDSCSWKLISSNVLLLPTLSKVFQLCSVFVLTKLVRPVCHTDQTAICVQKVVLATQDSSIISFDLF